MNKRVQILLAAVLAGCGSLATIVVSEASLQKAGVFAGVVPMEWTCMDIAFTHWGSSATQITTSNFGSFSDCNSMEIGCSAAVRVYQSTFEATPGLRMGSSSGGGSITITFDKEYLIGQITIYGCKYKDTESGEVSVSNESASWTESSTFDTSGASSEQMDYYYNPSSPLSMSSIVIANTKRVYISQITLGVVGYNESAPDISSGGEVSSEEVISSEESIESSSSISSVSSEATDWSVDPYADIDTVEEIEAFETSATYTVASCYEDAQYRSAHGLVSGTNQSCNYLPPTTSEQHKSGDLYLRNTTARYTFREDGSYESYKILNADGSVYETIYYGGAYTGLDEVASYILAFEEVPANMGYNKNSTSATNPATSKWWRAGRVNYGAFSGPTDTKYTYEPACPGMAYYGSNNGTATRTYFEADFGDWSSYNTASYVSGAAAYTTGGKITRGVLRFVFTGKYNACSATAEGKTVSSTSLANLNKSISGPEHINDRYVFYTYDHYGDNQEYLNYAGGWGKRFGSMSAGNSSPTGTTYAPTEYPATGSWAI